MISDEQYYLLLKYSTTGANLEIVAAKSGMCETTARKYLRGGVMPSEMKKERDWKTRKDPFSEDWIWIKELLAKNGGLQAKFIFQYLQRLHHGRYQDGQLRTLQRKVKIWRATEGPPKIVMFEQTHHPGKLSASDFTSMDALSITINRELFRHKIYHFMLPYSNWETGNICFSESWEALSDGFQKSCFKVGKVPKEHLTDSLTAAVNNLAEGRAVFQKQYSELVAHYNMSPRKTNPRSPNENGDSEKSHDVFKVAVDQSLMLRGSRDFSSREEYEVFLQTIFDQLNAGRMKRFQEELAVMQDLPERKIDSATIHDVRVNANSTIRVKKKRYSLPSRFIGETVRVKLYSDYLEVWYGQKKVEKIPRLLGEKSALINYRHIIDSLIRKPGAFNDYQYKSEMFPTVNFRVVYDHLEKLGTHGVKQYLQILRLASEQGEEPVNKLLQSIDLQEKELAKRVEVLLETASETVVFDDVSVADPDLAIYDFLDQKGGARS